MKKVLIANRGEIAVRIARACADYGVASVAVYADPDAEALHTRCADEAWALPGRRPVDTYLNGVQLLDIARRSGADAVHPGYGFLSENADFAQAVIDAGLTWIGPPPEAIRRLGDKVAARQIALSVGAPLVAGSTGPVLSAAEAEAFAVAHGLPIIIKAAHGGGGRGMKIAWQLDEVREQYESAVREATVAFGRGECFIEQFLDRPRHIEAQVLADTHGHVVVLGTRDCSLQRRNQKLVEEAPAPFLTPEQREHIHRSAQAICAAAGYVSAGTVEFLLGANGVLSFLEVNTRLQVEHPVTEVTTGLDLVVEQLRVADGLALSITETPAPQGHAIELRINAEDVGRGFLPTPGPVQRFEAPSGPGIRVDSGVQTGSVVPGDYDSLMAKLIVHGATRDEAIKRARRALREFHIEGLASVLPFHKAVLDQPDFCGPHFKVHTRWIETDFAEPLAASTRPDPLPETALWRTTIEIDGRRVELGLPAALRQALAGGMAAHAVQASEATLPTEPPADPAQISAPISGSLVQWLAEEGAELAPGDPVAVMEAMKMETRINAHCKGQLKRSAQVGQALTQGEALGRIL